MTPESTTLLEALAEIAESKTGLVSSVAAALAAVASADGLQSDASDKQVKEGLFALVSHRIAQGLEPIAVVDALVSIDELLAARTGLARPFAVKYASSATALICHIDRTLRADRLETALARSAPIIEIGKNTLKGVLIGPIRSAGASIFADRVLGKVLKCRPKRVDLIVRADPAFMTEVRCVTAALLSDLKEQRIDIEIDDQPMEGIAEPTVAVGGPTVAVGIDNENEKYYTGAGSGRNMEIQGSKAD